MACERRWWQRLALIDAHHRLMIAAALAVPAFFLLPHGWPVFTRALSAWNILAGAMLILSWVTIIHADPGEAAGTAKLQDSSYSVVFAFVLIAACASLFTVGALLGAAKGLGHGKLVEHIIFAVGTVFCSWTLVHTIFTLRYAHIFYDLDENNHRLGGLLFPGEDHPDYLDFAYFSFVVGMTCQVSDVGISGRRLRRLALVHGLIAFGFNTAIVAMSVNLISGLFA